MKKTILFAAGLALALPALADESGQQARVQERAETRTAEQARAQQRTEARTAEQVRAQVMERLEKEGHVPEHALARVREGFDRHAEDRGYGEAIRTAVHDSLAAGCRGTCLADVIHEINGAMDRGASAAEAAARATRAGAARGDTDRTQLRDRARDHAADTQRDMDRTRDRAQGRAGGHGPGMGPGRR